MTDAAKNEIIPARETLLPVVPQSESAAIISMIERMASDPTVDLARLEKILELRERVEARNARMAYIVALAELQPTLPVIDRRGRIVVHNKEDRNSGAANPRIVQATPYALWEDINDAIKALLAEHGFSLSFRTGTTPEGKITVTGILSHREGHSEETTMILTHDSTGSKNAVQAIGSSISYGKRYTAGLLLNITSRAPVESDDDGKAAADPATITEDQALDLRDLIESVGTNMAIFLKYYAIGRLEDLPASKLEKATSLLQAKASK